MSDSNNAPGWKLNPEISGAGMPGSGNSYGEAGNGRGVQQNALPKGARMSAPSDNAPTVHGASLDGNGYGNYDPRYAGKDPMEVSQDTMPEVHGKTWGVSGNGGGDFTDPKAGDRATAYQHQGNEANKATNAINNDSPASDRVNPYRSAMKKEWSS